MAELRTKAIGNLSDTVTSRKLYSGNCTSMSVVNTLDLTVSQDYYRHWGESIPRFHQKLRDGVLLPLTYWYQARVVGGCSVANHELNLGSSCSYWDNYRPLLDESEFLLLTLDLETLGFDVGEIRYRRLGYLQAAAAELYSRGWDGLTFVAELHKLIDMFSNFVLRAVKTILKGDYSSAWLEGRYGWRILLYDIEDINNLIEQLSEARPEFAKERVGGQYVEIITESPYYADASGTRLYNKVTTLDVSLRGNIVAAYDPPAIIFNPVNTAWELVKFSFIVDWILNVGTWIQSLSFLLLSRHHYAAVGTYGKITREVNLVSYTPANGYTGDSSFSSKVEAQITERLPSSVPLRPLPGLDLDVFKVADLLALFLQTVNRAPLPKGYVG